MHSHDQMTYQAPSSKLLTSAEKTQFLVFLVYQCQLQIPDLNASSIVCNTRRPGLSRTDQDTEADVQAYRTAAIKLKRHDLPFADGSYSVLYNAFIGFPRPIVPKSMRRKVFNIVHALSHLLVRSTKSLIASKLVQYGFNKEVTD